MRPESVETLTPGQLQILLLQLPDAGRTVELSPCEAEQFRLRRVQQKESWINQQLANLRRPSESRPRECRHHGIEMLARIADDLITRRESEAPPAADLQIGRAEFDIRRLLSDVLKRFDDLPPKNRGAPNLLHPEIISRFSDGP